VPVKVLTFMGGAGKKPWRDLTGLSFVRNQPKGLPQRDDSTTRS
jgi:hypothetical protein